LKKTSRVTRLINPTSIFQSEQYLLSFAQLSGSGNLNFALRPGGLVTATQLRLALSHFVRFTPPA
jgi:hypothetical protein